MGCKVTKLKGCEIAGSTFSGRKLVFADRDISGDTFTAKVSKGVRFGTITEIVGIKNGSNVFFSFTKIENLKAGTYLIEYWATFAGIGTEPFASEDFKVLSEGCNDCGGTQTQPFTIQFEDVSIPVTIEHSVVNVSNYLNYESLTEEQKAELKGDKGDAFTYSDFTAEQIANIKKPATDAAQVANDAANNANNAAQAANNAASASNATAQAASTAASEANTAAQTANNATAGYEAKLSEINAATTAAGNAASSATTASQAANNAADAANQAAQTANNAKGWSPVLVLDTTTIAGKTLVKLSDWSGGTGTKPTLNVGMWAVGDGTYTNVASDAEDLRSSNDKIQNLTSANNAMIEELAAGTKVSRNVADSNTALRVDQVNASSTGNIADFYFAGTKVASIDKDGIMGLVGTGMPNGVVTGSVGQIYTDKAATNGAIRWIKKTGDNTNTGWVVEFGDTGWVNLPNDYLLPGAWDSVSRGLSFRRVNGIVFMAIGDATLKESSDETLLTKQFPEPFIPPEGQFYTFLFYNILNKSIISFRTLPSWHFSYGKLFTEPTTTARVTGMVQFITDREWPTTLTFL